MAKTIQDEPAVITSAPLTAEAREAWLHDLFSDSLDHYGELFVPRDSFYSGKTYEQKARNMLKSLCTWLGIKPGYIGLKFEGAPNARDEARRYTIYIEKQVLRQEFLLGATIATALTRYLLEEVKQVHLEAGEQHSIIATTTVVFGLGIVVANGLEHDHDFVAILGSTPPHEYAAMLHGFFRQRAIPARLYAAYVTPSAVDLLDIKKAKKTGRAVAQAYQHERHKQYQLIGLLWMVIIAVGLSLFILSQRVRPESAVAKNARQQVETLRDAYTTCQNTYTYNLQYTDTSDIQAQRNLNAEGARCTSINNELTNAQIQYQKIVNK